MQRLHAMQSASISELKKNPSKLIGEAEGRPVVILNHNIAAAYLIPAETYEKMLDLFDDRQLEELVYQRLSDNKKLVKVDMDDL